MIKVFIGLMKKLSFPLSQFLLYLILGNLSQLLLITHESHEFRVGITFTAQCLSGLRYAFNRLCLT